MATSNSGSRQRAISIGSPLLCGVRTERYKYIHFFLEPQEYELYDLQTDPDEDHNLYGQPGYEELTIQLRTRLEELRRETGDNYVYHPSRVLRLKAVEVPSPHPDGPTR